MPLQGLSEIEIDQRITTEHNKGVVKKMLKILDFFQATGRTHRISNEFSIFNPSFEAVGQFNAKTLTITEIVFNFLSQMRHVHHHFGETVLL